MAQRTGRLYNFFFFLILYLLHTSTHDIEESLIKNKLGILRLDTFYSFVYLNALFKDI